MTSLLCVHFITCIIITVLVFLYFFVNFICFIEELISRELPSCCDKSSIRNCITLLKLASFFIEKIIIINVFVFSGISLACSDVLNAYKATCHEI
jgi:hypothetical protein